MSEKTVGWVTIKKQKPLELETNNVLCKTHYVVQGKLCPKYLKRLGF
jgi:hypothetical protein